MMKNKKGDGHVDWIISIGIFLIFLLSIFVIIKPGVEPNYDYNTLLDNIEEHVKGDFKIESLFDISKFDFEGFYWTLYKTPLFFQEFTPGGQRSECITIDFPYDIAEDKINVYKIKSTDNSLIALSRKLSSNNLYIKEEEGGSWDKINGYLIYFSNNKVYNGKGIPLSENIDTSQITCIESTNGVNFNYNLGISENVRGVSEDVLIFLRSKDKNYYDKLKEIYGYPQSKEFSITITKETDESFTYEPIKPDVKSNVYVREWGDYILNYDGTRTRVKVSVKVW